MTKEERKEYNGKWYLENKERLKECQSQYRTKNKDKIKEYKQIWYLKNKERLKDTSSKYRLDNKEKIKEARKKYYDKYLLKYKEYRHNYYLENKDRIRDKIKSWRLNNKEKIREVDRIYRKNPLFKLKANLRKRLYYIFRAKHTVKDATTREILGCSFEFAKQYIENQFIDGMSWDNYGKWHVDHIVPLASAKNEQELKALCHYKNLQPLWAEDNLKKGAKVKAG